MRSLTLVTDELQHFLKKKPETVASDLRQPKLTIITPSYNQGAYLERTILSVLNQGYANLEYIIIDGGSTDNSVDIIRRYEKYLSYWVSEKDKGQVDAINKALNRATGEWIGFQNSDDVYFPGTFAALSQTISAQPEAEILYGDLHLIDLHDKATELLKTLPFSFRAQLIEGMQIHNQTLFFKKRLVDNYGLFDTTFRFAFDYEFITRYLSKPGVKAFRSDKLRGALRIHPETKSTNIADIGKMEHQRVIEAYNLGSLSVVPVKLQYLWCRIRKAWYLFSDLDFTYLIHRLTL